MGAAPSQVSSEAISRPRPGGTPSVSKKSPRTKRTRMISGRSIPVSVRNVDMMSPNDSNVRFRSRQSRKFGIEVEIEKPRGLITSGVTSSAGSCTGSGSSSTPFTMLKIDVLAPIPSAIVITAMAVNPGRLASIRKA